MLTNINFSFEYDPFYYSICCPQALSLPMDSMTNMLKYHLLECIAENLSDVRGDIVSQGMLF